MSLLPDMRVWNALGFCLLCTWFALCTGGEALALLLMAAALHELGHLLALRRFGAPVYGLCFSIRGVLLRSDISGLSYPRELCAALAGPAMNLACAGLLTLPAERFPSFYAAAGAHWVLAAFNLLPVYPLDGSRALYALAAWRLDPDRAERLADTVGGAAAVVCALGLVWLMEKSGGNLWLTPCAAGLMMTAVQSVRRRIGLGG